MKERLIPFRLCPASFGLKGDAYAIAEAHYTLDGEDLARKLAEITYKNNPGVLAKQLIELDFQHDHIDVYTYDNKIAELEITDADLLAMRKIDINVMHEKSTPYEAARQKAAIKFKPGFDLDLALLEIEHQFNKLTKSEFEKQRATLKDEPWVAIVNSGFDPKQGIEGVYFEFDWNDKWIEYLRKNGYNGRSAEQVIDEWFTDVCRSHTAAEFAGSLTPSRNLHRDD